MKSSNGYRMWFVLVEFIITVLLTQPVNGSDPEVVKPIANAGLPRYAAQDSVVLDGMGSYDPDDSGTLSYAWRQISGPAAVITDENTAAPTVSGFVQTDKIQECEFELVVSDGETTSLPDTVKVIIVPDFGKNLVRLRNPPFNPNKSTFIFFGGGDCIVGSAGLAGTMNDPRWNSRANVIDFSWGYEPDPNYTPGDVDAPRTYYRCGDMIIVYLSSVAPDYQQPIQTSGWSTGGQPALDVGIHLNLTYADNRYAINRVTLIDARACRDHSDSIRQFLDSSVDGEQCWIDNHRGGTDGPYHSWPSFYPNVMRIGSSLSHVDVAYWYANSLTGSDMNQFNHGVIGGAYWSVIGPGKNLQLASTPGVAIYSFKWYGSKSSGYMDFYDEFNHPGRLPEPITLVGPENDSVVDTNGAVFSCQESENAIGYQLLFGPDPYRVMDYYIVSDTPRPPSGVIISSPFEQNWWTVKAYDQYGSTIYADPIQVNFEKLDPPLIENITTGKRYGSFRHAIIDARFGHMIVVNPGVYQEKINFRGKNLTLRSTDPNNPDVVASTIINIEGLYQGPVVTLAGSKDGICLLAGLTIMGGKVGISCGDASPTISNCTIESIGPNAIEFLYGYEPTIMGCTILGSVTEVYDPNHLALWKMDETDGSIAYDSIGANDGICNGNPVWQSDAGMVAGALQFDGIDDYISTDFVLNPADCSFSVFAWVKGGAPGQAIISQSDGTGTGSMWLGLDSQSGALMTELVPPSSGWVAKKPLESESIISDDQWHHIGFVWDCSNRILYVDGIEVAKDAEAQNPLKPATGGLCIGASKTLGAGTFFSGLIDDVRIYDVALNAEKIAALAK
jgi:hypothetical protein